ncbi:MAG: hypothetical protein LBT40_03045 [Deltaproteobacteria bacterium]|nr:hypothetical protein [Deltaproteobacteria bacterium]
MGTAGAGRQASGPLQEGGRLRQGTRRWLARVLRRAARRAAPVSPRFRRALAAAEGAGDVGDAVREFERLMLRTVFGVLRDREPYSERIVY